jgi:Tol biopolymer transport system component
MTLKKILLLFALLASAAGIGFGLYFMFFRAAPAVAPEGQPPATPTTPGAGLPIGGGAGERPIITPPPEAPALKAADTVARGDVTKSSELTVGAVRHPSLSSDGTGMNFFDEADGKFYRVDQDGNVKELSSARFRGAEKATWNYRNDKAVIEFPDGSNIVYDFATQKQTTLPAHWEDFAFSPVRDEVIAESIGLDPDNRWLVTTNADGSQVKPIAALGENADRVLPLWSPNDAVVAFADTADPIGGGFGRKMIIPIGKNEENYKGLVVEGLDFIPKWAPNGKQLLYSVTGDYSNNRPLLWVVDATPATMGENRRSLGINTWADKCAFTSSGTLYCAVPSSLEPNVGYQRGLAADIPDYLYRIDVSTGRGTLLAIPETDKTMANLFVSQDESTLFFQETHSGKIETVKLK